MSVRIMNRFVLLSCVMLLCAGCPEEDDQSLPDAGEIGLTMDMPVDVVPDDGMVMQDMSMPVDMPVQQDMAPDQGPEQ